MSMHLDLVQLALKKLLYNKIYRILGWLLWHDTYPRLVIVLFQHTEGGFVEVVWYGFDAYL